MTRRSFLMTTSALVTSAILPSRMRADSNVSLRALARAARDRAYAPNTVPLSAPFADLDYDAFRGIRPLPGRAAVLPHGEAFAYDLLPPGLYFPDPVTIEKVTLDGVREVPFSTDAFSFDDRYFDDIPATSPGAGFTGLRLRYPLNAPDRLDEVLVMQGASYFRAIGQAMVYGLSARCVAIGTGGSTPEEFPRITRIRLHPAEGDRVRLEAMFDSPSLTGHIEMTLRPGVETEMEVTTSLFPRVDIADIGVAPLTSMYLKGPMLSAVSDDFRPRVHDSDVLVIQNGAGETLWRPIANPRAVETSAFSDTSPRRFGLYQTPRRFEAFQDTEAHYHARPSAFVEPLDAWGPGSVMLVEIPTGDEFMDNIVAFWRPEAPLRAGEDHSFSYRLVWTSAPPDLSGLATVLQSLSGREHDRPGHRRFVVDFDTPAEGTQPVISASSGAKVLGVSAFALPDNAGTRVTFLFDPGEKDAAELRLSLEAPDNAPAGPVWLHRWTRARDGGV